MYHRPAVGDVVRYEDTDDWDTVRDEEDREVGRGRGRVRDS
jgi:hypothetical protein